MAHAFRHIDDSLFVEPPRVAGHAQGFRRADLIGREQGSVHMGFRIGEFQPGGAIDACIHSFEKGIFVTDGEIELNRDGQVFRLGHHDYALIPIGKPHALRNAGAVPARWVEKCAPRPKEADEWRDSFFVAPLDWSGEPQPAAGPPQLGRMVGHFEPSQLPPPARVDAYMWGWSKKLLIDRAFGGHQFDLFIIDFEKDGQTSLHDHNFEEAYLVLEGEVTFEAEGKEYVLTPGTIAWSGVGAPHAFFMNRGVPCRWLEVMSPQPPAQHGNRRMATWDDIRNSLEA